MIDAAEVHAKASALFEYGRESSDMDAKSTRKEINSAFFQAGIVTADQEGDLAKVLDGRYPEYQTPPNLRLGALPVIAWAYLRTVTVPNRALPVFASMLCSIARASAATTLAVVGLRRLERFVASPR